MSIFKNGNKALVEFSQSQILAHTAHKSTLDLKTHRAGPGVVAHSARPGSDASHEMKKLSKTARGGTQADY